MTPYYADDWLDVYIGDCRAVLATMPAESVHCVVTSPPYWGLRDYGTATWDGGDADCAHTVSNPDADGKAVFSERVHRGDRSACRKCGATRIDNQLGLEPTPEQYVENMVAVFREVKRVLRNDGTLWLNLGDSYAGSGKGPSNSLQPEASQIGRNTGQFANGQAPTAWLPVPPGLKPKDLVGIPWRVAFALQADGWYLRSDIIWSKPNPMPESVTDRPTKSHEYLFLLAKSERYYFDNEAVREAAETDQWPGIGPKHGTTDNHKSDYAPMRVNAIKADATPRNDGNRWNENDGRGFVPTIAGRNIRSVWTVATQPYPGAHFATFPPKLIEPCIKAGAPTLGVVLDPFGGSGTTAFVAQSLSRRAILIDLNPDYIEQQLKRNAQTPLGLTA